MSSGVLGQCCSEEVGTIFCSFKLDARVFAVKMPSRVIGRAVSALQREEISACQASQSFIEQGTLLKRNTRIISIDTRDGFPRLAESIFIGHKTFVAMSVSSVLVPHFPTQPCT